jgi:hypothetical protein
MRAWLKDGILYLHREDVPSYQKKGSIVRNTFFWALKSISCHAPRDKDWEFDPEVWIALSRMLLSFTTSGYLGTSETMLEFSEDNPIPEVLRSVASYL